jgi:Predicted membrane protein (DUF2232)
VKAFVHWLLAQRQRLIIVAIVTAPLLQVVTASLLALETARYGVYRATLSAVIVVAGLALLAWISRGDIYAFAIIGVLSAGSGVLVGGIIRWAGNLVLAYQAILLLSALFVVGFFVFGPATAVWTASSLADLEVVLRSAGYADTEIKTVLDQVGAVLPALPALMVFSSLASALLLGYWWWCLAGDEARFSAEFRALKLGRWLGAATAVIFVLGLVFDSPLVQNLLLLGLSAAIIQGMAVLHTVARARRWGAGLMVLWYVVMIFLPPVMLAFGVVGLLDNWVNLRARIREV